MLRVFAFSQMPLAAEGPTAENPAAEAAAGDRPKANPVVATIATMSGVQAWGHLRD